MGSAPAIASSPSRRRWRRWPGSGAIPGIDPLRASNTVLYPGVPVGILPARGELARLQLWALRRIGERFRLRRISPPNGELAVVELEPRR